MPKGSDPDEKDGKEQYKAYRDLYLIGTVGVQIVVSLLIGFGIGLALDRWLGTAPWFMLLFILFGVAAGFLNVYREATKNGGLD